MKKEEIVDLKKPLRHRLLGCKVTDEEYKKCETDAKKHDVSLSRWLRFKIFGVK